MPEAVPAEPPSRSPWLAVLATFAVVAGTILALAWFGVLRPLNRFVEPREFHAAWHLVSVDRAEGHLDLAVEYAICNREQRSEPPLVTVNVVESEERVLLDARKRLGWSIGSCPAGPYGLQIVTVALDGPLAGRDVDGCRHDQSLAYRYGPEQPESCLVEVGQDIIDRAESVLPDEPAVDAASLQAGTTR